MRGLIMCALLQICGSVVYCQDRETNVKFIESVIEKILGSGDFEHESDGGFVEELTAHYAKLIGFKLNINRARDSDFESLKLLTEFEIEAILDYRKQSGAILSFLEFSLIPGVDPEKLKVLQPFVTFNGDIKPGPALTPMASQTILRSSLVPQKRQGYMPVSKADYNKNPDIRYLGSPIHLYGQTTLDLGEKATLTVITEKDPGERTMDYLSWNVSINKIRIGDKVTAEKIVVGSYSARFGQGLILWNGFVMDSSWDPFDSQRREQGINNYRASDENAAFKGVAASVSWGRLTTTLVLSARMYDARVVSQGYTSLLKTGLHNTTTTVKRKGTLGSNMAGININYSSNSFKVGFTATVDRYLLLYAGKDTMLLQKAAKYQNYYANIGTDWRYVMGKAVVFGELATDISGSPACISGLLLRVSDKTDFSALFKYSSAGYLSRLSAIDAARGGELSLKFSIKKIISGKSRVNFHTTLRGKSGKYSLKFEYEPANNIKLEIRGSKYGDKGYVRSDFKFFPRDYLTLHSRGDISFYKSAEAITCGFNIHQELIIKTPDNKLALSARCAWFDIPHWENRIYSYEREILYQFRTTALYGRGIRWYLNLKLALLNYAEIWLRYSSTTYSDRDKTGEGLEMIQGPSKGEAKIQLRIKL
jgi:hypothetical protein